MSALFQNKAGDLEGVRQIPSKTAVMLAGHNAIKTSG